MSGPKLFTLEELLRDDQPPFRVPGLVHRDLTGVAGVPYAGKSALAAELAMGLAGGSFLGRDWNTPPDRALLVCADVGAHRQMAWRLDDMGMDSHQQGLLITKEAPRTSAEWASLRQRAELTSQSVVVIDNLSAIVADFNDSKACREFFDAIRLAFVGEGISTVVLLHLSEKAAAYGPQRLQPLGSTVISASLRHVLYLVPKGGGVSQIVTRGNDLAEPEVLTIQARSGKRGPAGFEVLDESLVSEGKRLRQKATLDRNAEIAQWVVENCQGRNKQETANLIASKFGGQASGHGKNLQPSRPLGKMLELRPEGNAWAIKPAA